MKEENRKIVFGIGNQKKNMATYLMEHDENVILVVDNDSEKQGKKINGRYIIQPVEKIMPYKDFEDVIIIITAHSVYEQMKQQLIDLGWDSNRIQIAILENPFFGSFEYKCYINGIDVNNPKPTILNVELSGFCNCKCVYCPFHGKANLKEGHKGLMNVHTMKQVINQIKNISTIKTVDTTGPGEIFINSNWYKLLQMLLDETSIEEVYMYTNGMLLTEDNARLIAHLHAKLIHVEVSIDGVSSIENDEYRIGAKYSEIKKNIYNAKKIFDKKNIQIIITNCYPGNLNDIEKDNFVVDSKKQIVPEYLKNDFQNIPIVSQTTFFYGYDVQIDNLDKVKVRWKDKNNRCMNLFHRLAIAYDGGLLRCSCGQAGIETIGNVFEDNVLELWENDRKMNEARYHFIEGIDNIDFCSNCPSKGLGTYNVLVRK